MLLQHGVDHERAHRARDDANAAVRGDGDEVGLVQHEPPQLGAAALLGTARSI